MIDSEGFRANVGIILTNDEGRVFWARRIGQNAWQFPQGGIRHNESPEQALYRELAEEVGLQREHVELVGSTTRWLRYHLPRHLVRRNRKPVCIGQKQLWFMLRLVGGEHDVRLDASERPEFDDWCWVDYWKPVRDVVFFKRHVYQRALQELAPLVFPEGAPEPPAMPSSSARPRRRRQSGRG
ncbi:MAG: RNA pyrophosphohydrolase [Ectothiorhodospiraceae bacterium]|nr:RNA pyrophosphohydrolase [Ectothiorhodospiraceae bacterium]